MSQTKSKSRIQIVDAIRGFALVGILFLHCIEHFDLLRYPESGAGVFSKLDTLIHDFLFFVFAGKAYSIFSLMFGFSFFIQMRNMADKGVDFRWGFLWRLTILFAIGYLHSLIYIGDVLTVFAIMGIPLVFMYKLPKRFLVWLAVLFFLQVPMLFQLGLTIINPAHQFQHDWSIWGIAIETFASGSFQDVLQFNAFSGYHAKWVFYLNSGRYLQMIGLIICGLLVGRSGYFENIPKRLNQTWRIFILSILAFVGLYVLRYLHLFGGYTSTQQFIVSELSATYANLAFTAFLITGFILLFTYSKRFLSFNSLSAYGRMSLSSYILQPLIGVPFFYNYALGMYKNMGTTWCFLYAIGFLVLQLLFSSYWLKRFHYGPFEWVWRSLTFLDFKTKFRRVTI